MRLLRGHAGPVHCLAYSPNGRLLASGGEDRSVRVWDLSNGGTRSLWQDHSDWVRAVAFSPSGKRVASASWDGTGCLRARHSRHPYLFASGILGGIYSLAFAPDGYLLAFGGGDGGIRLRHLGKDGLPITQPPVGVQAHTWPITAMVFSPSGNSLATGSLRRSVDIWDGFLGRQRASFDTLADWVRALAYHPGGEVLAAALEDGSVILWDVPARKELRRIEAHRAPVCQAAFTPDGRSLLSGSWDGTVRIWDWTHGRECAALDWKIGRVYCLAVSPDGMTAAAGGADGVVLWDLD
jgi:WD40 repeat protein